MAYQLEKPPSTPSFSWKTVSDWLYKLWYILQGISGDGTQVIFPSNVTVVGNETIDGNLQVNGNINGTSTYTILLGVYSGLLGE